MRMYSQSVNQFIMRSLVRELAGKGGGRRPSQAGRLPRAEAPRMGLNCMERGRGHSRWGKAPEQTSACSRGCVYCNSGVIGHLPMFLTAQHLRSQSGVGNSLLPELCWEAELSSHWQTGRYLVLRAQGCELHHLLCQCPRTTPGHDLGHYSWLPDIWGASQ